VPKMPDITISVHVDPQYTTGFVVRTIKDADGKEIKAILSRKSGKWIPITAQQIREHDIRSECIFAPDDLPADNTVSDQP
jgi:hypothetical protein